MLIDDTRVVPLTLLAQLGSSLALAGVFWIGWSGVAAVSAALGGALAVLPNAFLAARLLEPRAGASARALLVSAWVGAAGKLVLTGVLFAAVLVYVRPLSPPAVFGGFMIAQLMILGALLRGGGPRSTELTTKS